MMKRSDSFDLLRVRIEGAVSPPGVISVTSGKVGDRQNVAAHGLADALANAGYKTLLIDTSLPGPDTVAQKRSLTLAEIAASTPAEGLTTTLHEATFANEAVQQMTALTALRDVFDDLRQRFDYIVVETECALASSFALNVAGLANAVLVSIKKGRRLSAADEKLARILGTDERRFLGVIAVDKSITEDRVVPATRSLALTTRSAGPATRSVAPVTLFEPPARQQRVDV